MKKLLLLLAVLTLSLTLSACGETTVEVPAELAVIPEVVDMTNVDEFLGRPDVQYVDLRNFDDKMKDGYIAGFEMIPFFDYLEAQDILVRTNDWTFEAAGLVSENAINNLFDMDKTIFLMCGSGTRAGFVMDALESAGYTDVYNVGGLGTYAGDHKVLGDGVYNVEVVPALPAVVNMENVDMYLGRDDVQYVDLRNFDDKMKDGFIAGFEMIPFFEYLEYSDILFRTNDWTFEAAGIGSQGALENLFDMDKTIFLMCGSGTRAGFVMDALESIGYTKVINIGGIGTYAGDYKVLGDGAYNLTVPAVGPYTPGTYFAVDPQTQYTTQLVIGANGAIESVVFDAMYHGTTKNTLDTAYTLASGFTWKAEAEELAAYIVANQGWGEILLDVTDITGMTALDAPSHIIEIDHTGDVDAVAGVTVGAEGFVLSWNLAIEMASVAGTVGLVPDVPTSQEWLDANLAGMDYIDGVYFGMDEASGYNVKVTIVDGFIVDVFFDAIYGIVVEGTINDNGTPLDYTDDFVDTAVTSMTTKQVLQDGYTLASGFTWAFEADALAAAILEEQQWNPAWVITIGTGDDHDLFDMTDADTLDAVGGVTIGIEGFVAAYEEAIAQAVPVT